MADARRLPVACLFAGLVLAGALVGEPGDAVPSAAPLAVAAPSAVAPTALSTAWFCAGATQFPDSVAAGRLVFSNAGPVTVDGTVRLVSQVGFTRSLHVSVPARGTMTVEERLQGLAGSTADHWVGAIVSLYGGMTTVNQVLVTKLGSADEPCASTAARQWYFADGTTLRNAWDEISLLNPYPHVAVADLTFTTEEGIEMPLDFQGVTVPADGMAVLNLGSHLRRRQHIAVTVTARTGELVAFQTQIVTPPPAGAPPRGAPGAVNPVLPIPGVVLSLGSPATSTSLWWPNGGEGPGLTESYAIYNPGNQSARLSLELVPKGGPKSAFALTVGPGSSRFVTTNGAPWAPRGLQYSAHLESSNGAGVVADRFALEAPPAQGRGVSVMSGEQVAAREWALAPGWRGLLLSPRRMGLFGQAQLYILNPGSRAATVSVEEVQAGGAVPLGGAGKLVVAAGATEQVQVPPTPAGGPIVVASSVPVLVEQDWSSSLRSIGTNLSPAAVVSTAQGS